MKIVLKPLVKALAVSAFLGSLALTARANTVTLTQAVLQENPQQQGGEFVATSATLSNASYAASTQVGSGFDTFCMAYDQEFSYGQTLTYVLTNHTDDTSAGTRTALTSGVAWLYSQFALGNLAITTGAQDTDFQDALWYLQNSNGGAGFANATTNQYLLDVKSTFGSLSNAELAAGSNNYGVQIVLTGYDAYNSTTGTFAGGYSQPQLYFSRVPDAGSTIALLGLSLLGIAGFRRKFASAK